MAPVHRFLLAGLAATACACAGSESDSPGRVLLFSRPDFRGQCLILPAGASVADLAGLTDPAGRRWDDRIASVKIDGNARLELFADSRFHGARLDVVSSAGNLGRYPLGPGSWMAQASSVRVLTQANGTAARGARTVEDANQMIEADYVDLLGHRPDYAALQYYRSRVLDDRWTATRLRAALRASPEFAHRNIPQLVDQAYLAELGRRPDAKTRGICERLVAARNWSESDLRQELQRSEEARRFRARNTVRLAYRTVLGREPDAVGMSRYQKRVLGGWTLRELEDRLARSVEYRRLHPQAGVQP